MILTNPTLYIDKDNIVKVLTVEIPKEPVRKALELIDKIK